MKLLLFAVALVVLPIVEYGQTAEQQRHVDRQKAQSQPRGAVPALQQSTPSTGTPSKNQRETESTAKRPNPAKPSSWAPQSLGDILGGVTLIVTGFFLFYTIKTWREMVRSNDNTEKSNQENDKHTEESLRLTRESNDETRRAVEVAERQAAAQVDLASATLRSVAVAEQQLAAIMAVARATLVVTSVQPIPSLLGPLTHVLVDMTNTGHTTALGVKVMYGSSLHEGRDVPPRVVDSFSKDLSQTTGSFGMIGPGKSVSFMVELPPFDVASVERVRQEVRSLWVFGKATYGDIFGRKTAAPFLYQYNAATGQWFTGHSYNQPQNDP